MFFIIKIYIFIPISKVSGVQEENIVCSPIESCPNGKAPVRFPGKCCQQCGKATLILQHHILYVSDDLHCVRMYFYHVM